MAALLDFTDSEVLRSHAELFTHEYDAIGVPLNDVTALASAMATLARDSAFRERLGTNARRSVVQKFSRDRLGPQLVRVYETCRQGQPARARSAGSRRRTPAPNGISSSLWFR